MRQVAVANEMMTVGHVVTLTMPAAAPSVAVANEMMTVGRMTRVPKSGFVGAVAGPRANVLANGSQVAP